MRILIIEDDPDLNRMLTVWLKEAGYHTKSAFSGTEALYALQEGPFDALILDLMLPGVRGEAVLEALRQKDAATPVIVLSGLVTTEDKLRLFSLGATDYLTKPFDERELLARIAVHTRSQEKETVQHETYGDLTLDVERSVASWQEEALSLTPLEFRLLHALLSQKGKAISRRSLAQKAWPEDAVPDEASLSVHISNLRKKLSQKDVPLTIEAVWGIGYVADPKDL